MNVASNMAFSLKLKGVPRAEIDQQVGRAADVLGLRPLLARYPRELSGGQRQRVAMGRAIVRNPEVFLFDEPLSNLDAKLRVAMRAEIKTLHQRLGTTTVYVTHDQIEAMTMADKIVVMRDGVVEQIGAPLDLYDHPDNLFVAGFIGSPAMNFIEGAVMVNGTAKFVAKGGFSLQLPHLPDGALGRRVVCGFRPEHLQLGAGGFDAEVSVVEPTGSEMQIVVRAAEQDVTCTLRKRRDVRPGDRLPLMPSPGSLHLFDAETGRSLH
jgi:multiple sugar transport system ATP-binding protein